MIILKAEPRAVNPSRRKHAGFTLLELLVSITILSLIVTISYSALRLGTRSWDASIKNIDNNSIKRSTLELIKNKVEHIYPISWKQQLRKLLAFQGEQESIKFIAPSPQGREVGEYFEYFFVIDKGMSDTRLKLFYAPHDPGNDDFAVNFDSPSRILLDGLKDAKFAFYGNPTANEQAEWFDHWEDKFDNLPSAVQIVLKGKDGLDLDVDMVIKLQSELYQI